MDYQRIIKEHNSYKKEFISSPRQNNNIQENGNIASNLQINDPLRIKQYQYFPIESEKSKNGGHTIYLVTNGGPYKNIKTNNNDLFIKDDPIKKINKKNLIEQRSIEFKIDKSKFSNLLNGSIHLKENKSQKKLNIQNINNKTKFNNIKILNKDLSIKDDNKKNIKINLKDIKQAKKSKKIFKSMEYNNSNFLNQNRRRNNDFQKKINIKQSSTNNNGISNEDDKYSNSLSQLNLSRNDIIKKNRTEYSISDSIFDNLNENKKTNLSNNNSLLDSFVKNLNNLSLLSHSFEVKDNINFLYNSLNFVKNNLNDDLNNSKIMDKNFLSGMKNEDRKNSLKKALSIYNRLKAHDKQQKINYDFSLTSEINKEINDKKINEKDGNISFNNDKDNNNKNNNDKLYNNNIEEEENENEFSFNSNLKKMNLENNLSQKNNINDENNVYAKKGKESSTAQGNRSKKI